MPKIWHSFYPLPSHFFKIKFWWGRGGKALVKNYRRGVILPPPRIRPWHVISTFVHLITSRHLYSTQCAKFVFRPALYLDTRAVYQLAFCTKSRNLIVNFAAWPIWNSLDALINHQEQWVKIINIFDNSNLYIISRFPIISPFPPPFLQIQGEGRMNAQFEPDPWIRPWNHQHKKFYYETCFCAAGLFMRLPAIFKEIICHVSVVPPRTVPPYHHISGAQRQAKCRLAVIKSARKFACK